MKISVCTIAYNEQSYIEKCIKQFQGKVDTHLVLVSERPWHGEPELPDATVKIAEGLGAKVITGYWESEQKQRNVGQFILSDSDWILIVDADEYYEPEDIDRWFKFLETAESPAYGIGKIYTYWKTPQYRIDPPEGGGLIVAVRPSVQFTDKRCINSSWDFLPEDIVMHHWSYVRTDEEMLKKITSFEHFDEIVPDWYKNVWKKWTPEMQNLHPVNITSFKRAICQDQKEV